MAQILLGGLAFAAMLALDWVSCLGIPRLKPFLGLSAAGLLGVALTWTLSTPGRIAWPVWTPLIGWPLLTLATALLVYSLFIEIPFTAAYARRGATGTLVRTGTYALVRHPGVLWFGLWALAWILVSRSRLMLIAGAVWLLLDIALAWLEDSFLFQRMFPGYAEYQRETPMLVPTLRSLQRCLRTWAGRAGSPAG